MNAPLPYAKHCEDRCKALRWQLQSFALAIAKLCVWDGQNCHRYHQSFLWFILIQKGREKKGWCNTLRQKGDFLGCFYSKSWSSPLFLQKNWLFQLKAVPLHYENPPSLFTMLKCASRFIMTQLYMTGEDGKQHILARFDWKKNAPTIEKLSLNWK